MLRLNTPFGVTFSSNQLKFKILRTVFLVVVLVFSGLAGRGQTVLLDPNGDGGFESGTTFAANNWTVVNGNVNTWAVGNLATSYSGSRGAYITNNSSYSYRDDRERTVHFYRNITVPSGDTDITLSFYWKGSGEINYDRLLVYTAPTTINPVAGTPASNSTTLAGATLVYTQTAFQASYSLQTITLPASLAGTTFRLIFTWQNDNNTATQPPVAIDNISLTSQAAGPNLTVIPTSLDFGYTASGGISAEQPYVLSGTTLSPVSGNITVTAPNGFEVSTTSGSGFASSISVPYTSATLANTTIYVRFVPTSASTDYSGDISNEGGSATIKNVAVTGTSTRPDYCSPLLQVTSRRWISNVNFVDINNSSNYNIYNDFTSISTDITQGIANALTITVNFSGNYSGYVFAWIDWDDDGLFESAAGEEYDLGIVSGNAFTPDIVSTSISAPTGTQYLGSRRMRISLTDNDNPGPCADNTFRGEVEDYTVNVLPACAPPTITTHPSTASQTLCIGSSATALSVAATGTGLTYQWYSNATSSNSGGSSVSGATSTSYTPATSTAGTLYYYCVVSSGGCSINSNVSGAITVVSPPVPDFSATITNTSCPASADGAISVTDLPTALTFVGGDDDYVNLGSNFLSGLTQFTIEGWIKVNKSDIGNRMGLFGQNDAIEFGFISNTLIECYTPATGAVQAPLTSYPNDNGWHHIAAVGTPTNIIIYIDGVQTGTGGSKAAATVYGTSTDAVKIGSHVYDPVGTNNGFTGQITKVGFYNTALSASDITNLAAGYTNYVSGGNLLAGYNFYEGTGTSLGSVTATGNGTFVNSPVWTELFNYTWTKTGDGSFSATTKNLSNISVGEYNIAVSNGSCQNSQSFTVGSVNTASTDPAGITGTTTICSGASTTLTISGGSLGTGAAWNWYSGTCGGTSVGTGNSILVSPTTTTTYFVRGEGTCNTTNCASTTVTVNPIPTLTSITANSTTVCEGGSVTISINGLLNGTNTINYDYTINGSTTSASTDLTATGGTATTTLNNLDAGSYTVEINSITVNSCTANFTTNNTVNWTVDPLPTATLSGGGTICNGASTTLSVDFTGTGPWEITTQRNGAEPVTVTNISVNPYTFDVSAAGTYTISAFNDDLCDGTFSGSAVVTVIPQPTAGILNNNSPLCAGDNAIFTLTGTTGAVVTYNVNSGSNQTVTLTGGTATITINSATDDQVLTLVSVNNGTCSQPLSASSTITVNPLPTVGSFN